LVTTIGESGTAVEISPDHENIWEAKFHLSEPLGAVYRSNRISGLYPSAFSISVVGLTDYNSETSVLLPIGSSTINIKLANDGSSSETFEYTLNDESGWFVNQVGTVFIEDGKSQIITLQGTVGNETDPPDLNFVVIPVHRPDLAQTIEINVHTEQSQRTNPNNIVSEFSLRDPYPNPFNSRIKIHFFLKQKNDVSVRFYGINGEELDNLVFQSFEQGEHFLEWDAGN
jgi:hypothetical protein